MKFKPLLISLTLGLALALSWLPALGQADPEQSQRAKRLVAGVTTDIDGQARDSQPDIDAAESYSCTALSSVSIDGPTTGVPGSLHTFIAAVAPPTATLPVTYTWQATGQTGVATTTHELSHTVSFAWSAGVTGTKTITVTAANCGSSVSRTHTITLELTRIYLPLVMHNWPPPTWHSECVDCPPSIEQITQGSIALDSAGHPHVAYGGDNLYYAWHDGTGWQGEVADPSSLVGAWAAIALDGDDHPHISYYNYDTGDLKYAHWDGSTWISETVDYDGGWNSYIAIDSHDRPHIAYRDAQGFSGTALKYAHWDGSAWQIDTIEDLISTINSRDTTLGLDGDDQPHISYSVSGSGGDPDYLYHAYLDGGHWLTETVATAEGIGDNALALNSAGDPRIIYCAIDDNARRLGYAWWDGGQWRNDTLTTSDNIIAALSLALDGSDVPHASYYLNADTSMHYAHWDGAWQFETVESGLSLEGEISSLALDGAGRPHLLYLLDNTTLKYAHQEGAAWQTEAVAQGGDPGRYSAMVLDQAERPHVIYADQDRMQLKYAVWDGAAWQTQAVDQGGRWIRLESGSAGTGQRRKATHRPRRLERHRSYLLGRRGLAIRDGGRPGRVQFQPAFVDDRRRWQAPPGLLGRDQRGAQVCLQGWRGLARPDSGRGRSQPLDSPGQRRPAPHQLLQDTGQLL
jgi:hypothetical protein